MDQGTAHAFWRSIIRFPVIVGSILLAPLVLLFTLIGGRFQKPVKISAREFETFLTGFIDGTGGQWDHDDYTSFEIEDPFVESIRQEVRMLKLPLTRAEMQEITKLRDQVRAYADQNERNKKPDAINDAGPI